MVLHQVSEKLSHLGSDSEKPFDSLIRSLLYQGGYLLQVNPSSLDALEEIL